MEIEIFTDEMSNDPENITGHWTGFYTLGPTGNSLHFELIVVRSRIGFKVELQETIGNSHTSTPGRASYLNGAIRMLFAVPDQNDPALITDLTIEAQFDDLHNKYSGHVIISVYNQKRRVVVYYDSVGNWEMWRQC